MADGIATPSALGALRTQAVEAVDCQTQMTRMFNHQPLGDGTVHDCWMATLTYQRGQVARFVVRFDGGAIRSYH